MSNLTGSRQPRPPYGTGPPSRAAVPTRRAPYRRRPVPVGAASRHTQVSRYRRRRLQWLVPWMFVAPALILFLYFKILPLAQGVQMSFYDVRPYLGDRYVGGGNYTQVIMVLIYKLGLEQGKLGVAAAGSMILFVATAAVTLAVHVWRRRAVVR